jgi:hypothetical protein
MNVYLKSGLLTIAVVFAMAGAFCGGGYLMLKMADVFGSGIAFGLLVALIWLPLFFWMTVSHLKAKARLAEIMGERK